MTTTGEAVSGESAGEVTDADVQRAFSIYAAKVKLKDASMQLRAICCVGLRAVLEAAPAPAPDAPLLWSVHVQGPDDVVPVASYEDAALLSEGLTWLALTDTTHEYDPQIIAMPMLWDGTPERHAEYLAKLGTRDYDYGLPTPARVEAQRAKFFARLTTPAPAPDAEVEKLRTQIERLASFIMAEVPGEPSESEDACDTAIRIMRTALRAAPASPDDERAIDEAAEQVIIAFGRGWDLDGVIVNLANALGVAIPDASSPPSAPETEVAS